PEKVPTRSSELIPRQAPRLARPVRAGPPGESRIWFASASPLSETRVCAYRCSHSPVLCFAVLPLPLAGGLSLWQARLFVTVFPITSTALDPGPSAVLLRTSRFTPTWLVSANTSLALLPPVAELLYTCRLPD